MKLNEQQGPDLLATELLGVALYLAITAPNKACHLYMLDYLVPTIIDKHDLGMSDVEEAKKIALMLRDGGGSDHILDLLLGDSYVERKTEEGE